jgi:hypothetical protein
MIMSARQRKAPLAGLFFCLGEGDDERRQVKMKRAKGKEQRADRKGQILSRHEVHR